MINLKKHLNLIFLSLVYFISRLPMLGNDIVNVDAPAWNYRAVQFWAYLKNYNFLETYRTYHPGVTLMWLSGFGQEIYSVFYKLKYGIRPVYFNVSNFRWILFSETLPLVLFNFAFIILLYKLIEKLFNQKIAFYSVLILLLEPFFIGNTRVLHLDGMLSLLGINSVLFFIKYQKSKRTKDAIFSGILFGLAVLTKVSSLTLFPTIAIISLLFGNILSLVIYAVAGLTAFLILFPACWVDPIRVITKIIYDGVIKTGQGGQPQIFFGQESLNPGILFYPTQFIFRASPVLIILLTVALYLIFSNYKVVLKGLKSSKTMTILGVSIYTLVYFVFMTVSTKKIDRYLIPLFPPLAIFAGYALSKVVPRKQFFVAVVLVVVSAVQILPLFPDFFAYFNPLVGGSHMAVNAVGLQDWATGYMRVTNYLNKKPGVENITLATYNDASVRPTFLGIVVSIDSVTDFSEVDYVVVQRDDARSPLILKSMSLDRVFYIGSYDYYYLYKNIQL
ncbi:MAG: glycosyltransferase family 39 protein [Patescibacteria group bacterium]